jgi:hypothetical protein
MRVVECICDGCGKGGKCRANAPAPPGWYYVEAAISDPMNEGGLTVCSEACKRRLTWRRVRRRA